MQEPDYGGALAYARDCLENDLPPLLVYHTAAHTLDEVLPAALRLARLSGLDKAQTQLLAVAAAFHDTGYTRQTYAHEQASVEIVTSQLPAFGFERQHLDAICAMIMATHLPQSAHTLAEQILADADLDVLGRDDYWERNDALRLEMANLGQPMSDREWYRFQLTFVESHRYFTAAARRMRAEKKREHVAELRRRLAETSSLEGAE